MDTFVYSLHWHIHKSGYFIEIKVALLNVPLSRPSFLGIVEFKIIFHIH